METKMNDKIKNIPLLSLLTILHEADERWTSDEKSALMKMATLRIEKLENQITAMRGWDSGGMSDDGIGNSPDKINKKGLII